MLFSWELFAQALVVGLMIGCIYALISIGLSLIWGVMRIVNFAHGEFLMLGMYIAYFLVANAGLNPYLTALITGPALFLIGVVIFQFTIRPILHHEPMNQVMLTLGLSLILQNLALAVFGPNTLTVRTYYTSLVFPVGPIIVRGAHLIAAIGALLATFALYWFLQKTDAGRSIRAAAQNRTAATLMGINVERTFLLAFGLGSACLGVAASLMNPFYYTSPSVGLFFGLIAYIVVVMGGLGSFTGTLAAGLIIGVTEEVGKSLPFVPGSLARVFMYGIFVLVLLFRPQGLFGAKKQ